MLKKKSSTREVDDFFSLSLSLTHSTPLAGGFTVQFANIAFAVVIFFVCLLLEIKIQEKGAGRWTEGNITAKPNMNICREERERERASEP